MLSGSIHEQGSSTKFSRRGECILWAFGVAADAVTLTNKKNKPLFGCLVFYLCSFSPCFVPPQKYFEKHRDYGGHAGTGFAFRPTTVKESRWCERWGGSGGSRGEWLQLMEVTFEHKAESHTIWQRTLMMHSFFHICVCSGFTAQPSILH